MDGVVDAAVAPFEDLSVLVDEEVVADVAPAHRLDVVGVDAAHDRGGLVLGIAVRPRGVVDDCGADRRVQVGGHATRSVVREQGLVGAPLRAADHDGLGGVGVARRGAAVAGARGAGQGLVRGHLVRVNQGEAQVVCLLAGAAEHACLDLRAGTDIGGVGAESSASGLGGADIDLEGRPIAPTGCPEGADLWDGAVGERLPGEADQVEVPGCGGQRGDDGFAVGRAGGGGGYLDGGDGRLCVRGLRHGRWERDREGSDKAGQRNRGGEVSAGRGCWHEHS